MKNFNPSKMVLKQNLLQNQNLENENKAKQEVKGGNINSDIAKKIEMLNIKVQKKPQNIKFSI